MRRTPAVSGLQSIEVDPTMDDSTLLPLIVPAEGAVLYQVDVTQGEPGDGTGTFSLVLNEGPNIATEILSNIDVDAAAGTFHGSINGFTDRPLRQGHILSVITVSSGTVTVPPTLLLSLVWGL